MATKTARREAEEAWALLMRMTSIFRDRMFAACAELDLSPPQLHALRELSGNTSLAMSELAEKLRCDASNITGIVDRLESRGLVERRANPDDRRVKTLVATPAGAQMGTRILDRLQAVPEEVERLSAADQRALRDILRTAFGT
jgi:DNA-binding MarR family transcriptional regulator